MSEQLIVSVSGVRGIVGEALTPESVLPHLRAFAATLNGDKVVLGADTRPSRAWLRPLAQAVLAASGKTIFDLGICPTPTIGIWVRKVKAAGGIAITASHNPIEYNGLKFFNGAGEFCSPEQQLLMQKVLKAAAWPQLDPRGAGRVTEVDDALEYHLEWLLQSLGAAGRSGGRRKKLKAVVDCCNGAGSRLAPLLLEKLGCETVALFDDPTQPFPHEAEPLPGALEKLCAAVKRHKADLGFALDPDADRLALVDEQGRPLGEERTLVLAADAFLALAKGRERKGPLVANLSTSQALDRVGAKYGVKVLRSPVGEAHVVNAMRMHGAPFGGEGNGGVIFTRSHPGRDAAAGIAWILIALRESGGTLSELNATIPLYEMARAKIPLNYVSLQGALLAARRIFTDARRVESQDGLKFCWDEKWFHLRPSNTEPVLRAIAEAPTREEAQELLDRAVKILR